MYLPELNRRPCRSDDPAKRDLQLFALSANRSSENDSVRQHFVLLSVALLVVG
jgi:hypothetical protein